MRLLVTVDVCNWPPSCQSPNCRVAFSVISSVIGRHFDVRLTAAYSSLYRLVFLLDASGQAEGEHHPHKLEHGTRLRDYIDSGSHFFAVVLINFIPLPATHRVKKE